MLEAINLQIFKTALIIQKAHAQAGGETGGGGSRPFARKVITNPLNTDSITDLLGAVSNFLFAISIPIATIMILWGAFLILTAAGRPAQIEKGKKAILWAVVGFGLVAISGGITFIVQDILSGGGGGNYVPNCNFTPGVPC